MRDCKPGRRSQSVTPFAADETIILMRASGLPTTAGDEAGRRQVLGNQWARCSSYSSHTYAAIGGAPHFVVNATDCVSGLTLARLMSLSRFGCPIESGGTNFTMSITLKLHYYGVRVLQPASRSLSKDDRSP